MKINYSKLSCGILWVCLLAVSSCKSPAKIIAVAGNRVEMITAWDSVPNEKALATLAVYKVKVDSIMDPVIGKSGMNMSARRPESLLSNLVADVLRESATPYLGRPADMSMINMGGLRSSLSAGDVTYRTVYEILPFENILCILTLKGKDIKELMKAVVKVGGEGLSNVSITVNKKKEILELKIGGEPVDDEKLYEVATVDYLAEGNDKMAVFGNAIRKKCMEQATIREIFIEYVKRLNAENKELTSQIEGRYTIIED